MQPDAMRIWGGVLAQGPARICARETSDGACGMEAIYYEGLPWKGRDTRVFAYLGVPPSASKANPVPGMVLVHGGGGTAFPDWVRYWMERGFAAIAMDCNGCKGGGTHANRPRHEWGGPPADYGLADMDSPVADQWMTHAIAAVVLGHNILHGVPGVDTRRVGITGVSWGGVCACIAAGIDTRYRLMVPVYGCGYVTEHDSGLFGETPVVTSVERWKEWWDPSNYLPAVRCPALWVNGTNDLAFSLPSVIRSSRLTAGERTLSMQYLLPHGHQEGWAPREIETFVGDTLLGTPGLPRIIGQGAAGGKVCLSWQSDVDVVGAEVFHTADAGHWRKREWTRTRVPAGGRSGELTVAVPQSAKACFVNLIDERGLVVSSDLFHPPWAATNGSR